MAGRAISGGYPAVGRDRAGNLQAEQARAGRCSALLTVNRCERHPGEIPDKERRDKFQIPAWGFRPGGGWEDEGRRQGMQCTGPAFWLRFGAGGKQQGLHAGPFFNRLLL